MEHVAGACSTARGPLTVLHCRIAATIVVLLLLSLAGDTFLQSQRRYSREQSHCIHAWLLQCTLMITKLGFDHMI